jgi:rhodanese-related sulfurtransferase
MTGSWLAQMGVQVAVTPPGPAGPVEAGPWRPARPPLPEVTLIGPAQVDDWLRAGEALVVDIDTSRRFLDGHVPGALWALRADLSGDLASGLLDRTARLVLASADGILAAFAAADLAPRAGAVVAVLDGGTAGWARSGRPLQAGPGEMLSPPVDVYRRPYEGTDVDPGRIALHVITGGDDGDQARDGDFADKATRYRRTDEFLDIVELEWSSEQHFSYDGEFYRVADAWSALRPPGGHLPIYFGGASADAIRVGGRHADVYAFWGEPLEGIRQRIGYDTLLDAAAYADLIRLVHEQVGGDVDSYRARVAA